jgi:inhibitor of the pro-sigma K processing machinery
MISLRGLAVNAIVGLVILFVANLIGLGVQISLITLLLCAVLGIPGAILVILLALFDIAFVASVFPAILAVLV